MVGGTLLLCLLYPGFAGLSTAFEPCQKLQFLQKVTPPPGRKGCISLEFSEFSEGLEISEVLEAGLVLFCRLWYAICESAVGKQHAVCSSLGFIKRGELLPPCFNFT